MARARTNIYLDDSQLDALRERAFAERRTVADLVREAVDRYLQGEVRAPAIVTAKAGLPAGDYPQSAGDWERRPYFLHEAQVSWADFVGLLHSSDDEARRWALTRLLDGGRWQDVWRLVDLEAVRADLPNLRFRGRWFWDALVAESA
jgi:hypothetical protein